MSRLDVASTPDLKRAILARLNEIYRDRLVQIALVCCPGGNQPVIDFWRRYIEAGCAPTISLNMVPTLKAACDWLGMSKAARKALAEALAPEPVPHAG